MVDAAYCSSKLIFTVYSPPLPSPDGSGSIWETRFAASITELSITTLPLLRTILTSAMEPSALMRICTVQTKFLAESKIEVGCSHWL